MTGYGLLIEYGFCTGCHSCEVACKVDKGLPTGKFGIQLAQIGPWKIDEDRWQFDYVPVLTDICDLCEERTAVGKLPTCVQHCQSLIIEHGKIEDLAAKAAGMKRAVLFTR